ncbi:hypothetical protein PV05_02072 [Exophiala xenobiotica]|uniref:Heterokaryon incompatibility domain-containing protein n=1 Tax=Exophiala xenobiotica TaxID=348802 RepID=A0A0D2FQ13_9EURO|nr:uncharacterized protein PV05_02072 [Exophiala xenobiotica]KIW62019.1 hypothetical protein PV05_02072 [Exophiala xenobiotica]
MEIGQLHKATRNVYSPLDTSRHEIRLLQFTSPSLDAALTECSLGTVSLDDAPAFVALSYVCGDPAITEDILVNGVIHPVYTNLVDGLHHVRRLWTDICSEEFPDRAPQTLRLWVDAICINQQDVGERNEQVLLMKSVYSEAALILSWLGVPETHNAAALEIFRLLMEIQEHSRQGEFATLEWMQRYPELCTIDDTGFADNRLWNSLFWFWALPYWRRTWILQEVTRGRRVVVLFGLDFLDLDKLTATSTALKRIARDLTNKPTFVPPGLLSALDQYRWAAVEVQSIRFALQTEGGLRLGERLLSSRLGGNLGATNPKDHIYGLLGVTELGLIPDYNITTSVSEVYIQYVRVWLDALPLVYQQHLSGDGTGTGPYNIIYPLQFLFDAGIGILPNPHNLPSWVPNYPAKAESSSWRMFSIDLKTRDRLPVLFTKCLQYNPVVQGRSLFVSGLCLGPVARVVTPPDPTLEAWHCSASQYLRSLKNADQDHATGKPGLGVALWLMLRCAQQPKPLRTPLLAAAFLYLSMYAKYEDILRVNVPLHLDVTGWYFLSQWVRTHALGCDHYDFSMAYIQRSIQILQDERFSERQEFWDALDEAKALLRLALERLKGNFRLATVAGEHTGLVPRFAEEGDALFSIIGFPVPVALRRIGSHYEFVGTSYVEGLSNCGVLESMGTAKLERIELR